MVEYQIENYTNPRKGYQKFADKLRLGHLIYDLVQKKVKAVDLSLLKEILDNEIDDSKDSIKRYFPIPLTEEWLIKVFEFESKYNAPNNLTIYTSSRHGLKIHKQREVFFIAIIKREKSSNYGMHGVHTSKPMVLFVNELMDYMFLLKRDVWSFTETELVNINRLIEVQ
jgi:hypothetical protein